MTERELYAKRREKNNAEMVRPNAIAAIAIAALKECVATLSEDGNTDAHFSKAVQDIGTLSDILKAIKCGDVGEWIKLSQEK